MNSKARRAAEAMVCCGLPAPRGVACSGCGKVPKTPRGGKKAQDPTPPIAGGLALAFPKPTNGANARKHPRPGATTRPRKALPKRNKGRAALALIEDFGPLGAFVRGLPCCVDGCRRGPCDPAHVRSRGAGHHAWIEIDGVRVGNIAPLCHPHHVEQHHGIRSFERAHVLVVRPAPGSAGIAAASLAAVAAIVGEWSEAGLEAGAPC